LPKRYSGIEVASYVIWTARSSCCHWLPRRCAASATAPAAARVSAVFLGVLPSAVGVVALVCAVARHTITTATVALYLVVAYVWLGA
jgi:hypothetical protein